MPAEKILVVDDDESILNMMAFALEREGYAVETAVHGQMAMEKLKEKGPFAVMLTDLMMPGIHGQQLLRQGRELDPLMETIVITAAGSMESAITALRADGAFDYLLKPLDSIKQLSLVVERALSHRKLLLEREALQARIRSEAEWLETLIANTGDAILAADTHGSLTVVNPAAVCLLGEAAQIGKPSSACLPYSLASLVSNWLEEGSLSPVVMELAWIDGSTQMVNLAPVIDKEKVTKGWVMVLRDISPLKNADEYRLKVLSEVVQRIQLPLVHAVNTLAELNQIGRQDDRIARAVYRLSNIWGSIKDWVDELAEMIKKEEKVELRQIDINIVPMLVQLQSGMGVRLREGGYRLVLGTLPNLPIVRTDPSLLSQLLEGLIERAAHRGSSGGNIHVNARVHQDKVWIDVSDDGPPVKQADLPHLFEKSASLGAGSQQPGEVPAAGPAAGPPLAHVKELIGRMGGGIWVSGERPSGSTITVCLPAAPRDNKAA